MDLISKKNSSRISKVALEECLLVLSQYVNRLPKSRKLLPGPTQPIWAEISKDFGGKWSARDVYRECKENRRDIWTKLHSKENSRDSLTNTSENTDDSVNYERKSNNTSTTSNSTQYDDPDDKDWEAPDLDEFEVNLSEDVYKKLCEDELVTYNKRKYSVFQRWAWADYLCEQFFKISESRCAFVFKNAKVYSEPHSVHHVVIRGKCKSNKCNNPFYGFIDKKPSDFPVVLRVRCKDTVFDLQHEDVRRPVRNVKRRRIGEEAAAVGPNNWLKSQLSALGTRIIPPIIPHADVVRKCCSEYMDNKLGIEKKDKMDVIKAIENMRYNLKYNNFIRDIKKDKFYIFYGSNVQLHAYKRYHYLMKIKKNKSKIEIDGTGSICKKITYDNGRTSGHIFFYTIIINFNRCTLSVFQLLTDDQSTLLIELWLKFWIRMGAPKPDQASCDYSRAIINALSLAFNEQNIKTYIETLFLKAIGDASSELRPPIATDIRLDVAHFIKMITNWKCIKTVPNKVIRRFYIFCVTLLIDAQTLTEFEEIFKNICSVCLNPFSDSVRSDGKSVLEIRKDLERLISGRYYKIRDEEFSNSFEQLSEECEDRSDNFSSAIEKWVRRVREIGDDFYNEGVEVNAFYNKSFIDIFCKTVALEFPLWSAACLPGIVGHATTAHVEAYFNDKKNRVLSNFKKQIRVDKFLRLEHQDHQGGSVIFNNKLLNEIRIEKEEWVNKSKNEKEEWIDMENYLNKDLFSYDNWRNKSKNEKNDYQNPIDLDIEEEVVKKKQSFYFHSQPSISFINEHSTSKNANKKINILQNGNSLRPILIDNIHYYLTNTCAFDSIVQILATAALDHESYCSFIETSTCKTLNFISLFIKTKKLDPIYKERGRLLTYLFSSRLENNHNEKKSPLFPVILNLYSAAAEIWNTCFKQCPSRFDIYDCSQCGQYTNNVSTIFIEHIENLCNENYQSLGKHLEEIINTTQSRCLHCHQLTKVTRTFNRHIYIELELRQDIHSELLSCPLSNLEKSANFSSNNNRFSLRGVVAYTPGHFKAYCRRSNGQWELHDDLESCSIPIKNNPTIIPSAAIYITV